jgi:hypothetical protein
MAKVALAGVSKMQPSDLSQMEKSLGIPWELSLVPVRRRNRCWAAQFERLGSL